MKSKRQSKTTFWSSLSPSRPYLYLIGTYLLGLVFFSAFRLLFLISFAEQIEGVPISDILYAFLIGIRFDQVVVMAILLPLLVVLPWVDMRYWLVRCFVAAWVMLAYSFSLLLLLGDIPYYRLMESRLNFLVIDYLRAGKTAWNLILTDPRLYFLLAIWFLATILVLLAVRYLLRLTHSVPHRRSWAAQVILFVVCLIMCVVGIRGRIGLASIKWGVAYFSQNHFVNQLGLNGVYTLSRALTEEGGDPRLSYLDESSRFPFVPFSVGLDSVQAMIEQPNDHWLDEDSSLLRLTAQPPSGFAFQPNVVIVLLESWSGRHTGYLGDRRNLTPEFDALASKGILFTDCYASGMRSSYGMAATLCSFPSLPGRSVMTRYNARHPFVSLSEILGERGYFNGFVYGGDLVFDNLEGFFTTKGYNRFWGEEQLGEENVFAKWGIPDHIVYKQVVKLSDSLPRPFQLSIFTLSNHEPFDLPDSSVQVYQDDSDTSKVFNAMRYADFALGQFFERAQRKPFFDSTVFVLIADHARWDFAPHSIHPQNFHIPLLIYSPALLDTVGVRIDKACSQVDLLPTLMGLLGSDYTHASWGRNILALPDDDFGYSVLNVLNRLAYMERDFYYYEQIEYAERLYRPDDIHYANESLAGEFPEDYARLQRRLRVYLQIAEQLSTPGAIE